jgi:small-conductance mechanosensitive channel
VAQGKLDNHTIIILRRSAFWLIFALFFTSALHQMGFKISVLLGAAGIVSVAVGFASQTSASNLISGLFVMGERSISIGDFIRVGDITGEVLSIDLLSVKLRTYDNLFVRIPNETIIKSQVTNMTRFPIRRFDLVVGVSYNTDIAKARDVLLKVASENILCLEEPKPLFILQGFNSSSIDIQFSIWSTRENFLELKNSMQQQVKQAFDEAGLEIPFPHISLYSGNMTKPFPVEISKGESNGK